MNMLAKSLPATPDADVKWGVKTGQLIWVGESIKTCMRYIPLRNSKSTVSKIVWRFSNYLPETDFFSSVCKTLNNPRTNLVR
jgi:hypothetical protein